MTCSSCLAVRTVKCTDNSAESKLSTFAVNLQRQHLRIAKVYCKKQFANEINSTAPYNRREVTLAHIAWKPLEATQQ